ncbi:MAG: CD225/dispanin family protein, partial [Mycobacterium sp.]
QAPNNYLVWSILVTFFCCLPFGIVAIVKSSQVNGLWGQGRFAEAQAAADSAKKWVTWAVVGGVITNAVVLAFSVFGNSDSSANAAAMLVLGL